VCAASRYNAAAHGPVGSNGLIGTMLAAAALTVVPVLLVARRPVADTLEA
jgi:hypothetical protein